MPGEPILIVDDTPINLKLTRILLVNEGFRAHTATSAEEALEMLGACRPHLVLADIQLPGMDGLELTRRIKQNEATRDIAVIALTAYAGPGDEQKAIEAGCDGYITKPIDTRTLGARIREFLDRRAKNTGLPAEPAPPPRPVIGQEPAPIPDGEMRDLRRRFLNEGQVQTRRLLADLDGRFDLKAAAKSAHQWIGAAGLLGYAEISRLSREVESVLSDLPLDNSQLRESLTSLARAFDDPR